LRSAGDFVDLWFRDILPDKNMHIEYIQSWGNMMKLGSFSVSLNVKNIDASQAFYEKLGFTPFAGDPAQGWLILRNDDTFIGLFVGMIAANTLTFNPGWDQNAQNLDEFEDVRDIQKRLKADGIAFVTEADETTSGPASFVVMDPDGNPILVDQHR
jgi:catechol 2,3-dioxygenase-like lactoylglutathione lyase family enzyme